MTTFHRLNDQRLVAGRAAERNIVAPASAYLGDRCRRHSGVTALRSKRQILSLLVTIPKRIQNRSLFVRSLAVCRYVIRISFVYIKNIYFVSFSDDDNVCYAFHEASNDIFYPLAFAIFK